MYLFRRCFDGNNSNWFGRHYVLEYFMFMFQISFIEFLHTNLSPTKYRVTLPINKMSDMGFRLISIISF